MKYNNNSHLMNLLTSILNIKFKPKPTPLRLFVVYRLIEHVTCSDPATGYETQINIEGMAGFLPCFRTLAEAKEASENGKYKIGELKILDT